MATFHQGRLPASSAELKANRQRARRRCRSPLSPSSASRDPSPPPRGPPPSPGTAGDRGVPNPRGTTGLGPLVPPCVALSINTRGDTAWLSPTPLPPREITGAPSFPRGHPTGVPALFPPRSFPKLGGCPQPRERDRRRGGALLTLPFKFADDGVQVGVLGGHMAPADRHRCAALRAPGAAELPAGAAGERGPSPERSARHGPARRGPAPPHPRAGRALEPSRPGAPMLPVAGRGNPSARPAAPGSGRGRPGRMRMGRGGGSGGRTRSKRGENNRIKE